MNTYIYQAELLCEDCAEKIMKKLEDKGLDSNSDLHDSDEYPKGPYPESESDSPEYCGSCGVFLENPLTAEGREYVKSQILKSTGKADVLKEWAEYYDIKAFADKIEEFKDKSEESFVKAIEDLTYDGVYTDKRAESIDKRGTEFKLLDYYEKYSELEELGYEITAKDIPAPYDYTEDPLKKALIKTLYSLRLLKPSIAEKHKALLKGIDNSYADASDHPQYELLKKAACRFIVTKAAERYLVAQDTTYEDANEKAVYAAESKSEQSFEDTVDEYVDPEKVPGGFSVLSGAPNFYKKVLNKAVKEQELEDYRKIIDEYYAEASELKHQKKSVEDFAIDYSKDLNNLSILRTLYILGVLKAEVEEKFENNFRSLGKKHIDEADHPQEELFQKVARRWLEKEALKQKSLQTMAEKEGAFGIISAYREGKAKSVNAEANGNMLKDFQKRGYSKILPLKGEYLNIAEKSVIIPNPKAEDIFELGKKYDQDSVILKSKEGVCAMYFFQKHRSILALSSELKVKLEISNKKDLYSKDRNWSFKLDFDWDQHIPWDGKSVIQMKDVKKMIQEGTYKV